MFLITSIERVKTGIPTELTCPVCEQPLVLIRAWGKDVCKYCYLQKPHKKGHSGMIKKDYKEVEKRMEQLHIITKDYPILIRIPKGDVIFSYYYLTHYPQSKGIVGRSLCYLVFDNILNQGKVIGIVSGNSPPYSIKAIDTFFGITKENRREMLKKILNNEVFRLIKTRKNLATQVLKSFRKVVKRDYKNKYNEDLIGLITFVEPPLRGLCYKADNWVYLGLTKGFKVTRRDKMWITKKWTRTIPKLIFAYKFR